MVKLRNGYTLGIYAHIYFHSKDYMCLKIFTAEENTVKIGNKVFLASLRPIIQLLNVF